MSEMIVFFQSEVRNRLSFLQQDYGFRLEVIDEYESFASLQFESDRVVLRILFSHRDHEIELIFGRKGIDDSRNASLFTIRDLLTAIGRQQILTSEFLSFDSESLSRWIEYIAELLATVGRPYLLGDKKAYANLQKVRSDYIDNWKLDIKLQDARDEMSKAWQKRDYAEVVRILEPIRNHLSEAEKKKFFYAQRHLPGQQDSR